MGDPINFISGWFNNLLLGWGIAENLVLLISSLIGATVVAVLSLTTVIALIWVERKLAARIQDRIGPNRAGPFGLFQPFADVIKIFTKEITTPDGADKAVFNIAPVLAVASVLLIWAVVPFTSQSVGADINVGVLYIIAVGSFGVVAIIMAGWSSNNKYALLGAFRAVAQMVSYEVPMVISLMIPTLFAGSMGIDDIVQAQSIWFILLSPIAALIFLITSMAEVGRAPFDLLEAESEIVAGFHIEYSGMAFGWFYVGEFLHVWTVSALLGTLFLGGWRGPGAEAFPIIGILYFYLKTFLCYFIITWIRLSVPRIRIDHMLAFNWKFLTPLALVVLVVTAILDKLLAMVGIGLDPPLSAAWLYVAWMLAANAFIIWGMISILEKLEPKKRRNRQEFEHRPVAVAPKINDIP
jgi:NADH-quinone oxidoreductase subunit H